VPPPVQHIKISLYGNSRSRNALRRPTSPLRGAKAAPPDGEERSDEAMIRGQGVFLAFSLLKQAAIQPFVNVNPS
jgi:hypothetical protein